MLDTINNNKLIYTVFEPIKKIGIKTLLKDIYNLAIRILFLINNTNAYSKDGFILITTLTALGAVIVMPIERAIFKYLIKRKENKITQIKKDFLNNNVSNSDIALVLEATEDHNNSFKEIDLLRKIESKTLKIVLKKVSTIHEINEAINQTRSQNNRIKAIIIRAHGSPDYITLSKENSLKSVICFRNVDLLASSFTKLDSNTPIILYSCSTAGKPKLGKMNIARKISAVAPLCKIIASSGPTNNRLCKYKKGDPLDKIEFWSALHLSAPANPLTGYPALKAEIVSIWNVFFGPTFNATVTYESFSFL